MNIRAALLAIGGDASASSNKLARLWNSACRKSVDINSAQRSGRRACMIALVKLIHITAIAIWAGGLVALPTFYREIGRLQAQAPEREQREHAVLRLQSAMRFVYVGVVSPAAFVAVGSGILLIFQGTVIAPWFALKLALVAGLVVAHSFAGLTLARLKNDRDGYPLWRYAGATGSTAALAVAILVLTLSKPGLDGDLLPAAMSEPGALKSILKDLNPWHRP